MSDTTNNTTPPAQADAARFPTPSEWRAKKKERDRIKLLLGAALLKHWPTLDYGLIALEGDALWGWAAKSAQDAITPLVKQANVAERRR